LISPLKFLIFFFLGKILKGGSAKGRRGDYPKRKRDEKKKMF